MSDWGWVAFAYGVVYVTLGAYVVSIAQRSRLLRRSEDSR